MFAEFKLLLRDVWSIYKGRMIFLVALMSLVAVGEGVSVALVFPLLTSIGITGSESAGVFVDTLNSLIKYAGLGDSVYALLALVTAAFFFQFVLNVIQAWWIAFYQRDYTARWQSRLLQAYIYARWTFFTHRKTGELVNTITTETSRLGGAFYILAQMAATAVLTTVYLALAFALSWQATTAIVCLAMVLFFGLRSIGKKSYQIGVDLGPLNAKLNVQANEYFGSAKLIKATATESKAIDNMEQTVAVLLKKNVMSSFLPGMVRAIFEFASMVALCLMLVLGHTSLNIAPANILLVLAVFIRLLPRFNALQQHLHYLNIYLPAMRELKTLSETAEDVSEKDLLSEGSKLALKGSDRMQIDLQNVSIEGHRILHEVSLQLPEHGVVGIVGKSGAGKSTLVHSILGLVSIQEGDINIGNISVQTAPLNLWRRHIGYVPQETLLFHESIKDNISWSRNNATMEEIRDAARRANADGFIEKLPDGYDTLVGDQGAKLSGGQRQRIGIARALLNQPEILLLDEATSALDSSSEAVILETVEKLRSEICIVSISHRLVSLKGADQIVVMDNGAILDRGSWAELMDRSNVFREIASSQHFDAAQSPA